MYQYNPLLENKLMKKLYRSIKKDPKKVFDLPDNVLTRQAVWRAGFTNGGKMDSAKQRLGRSLKAKYRLTDKDKEAVRKVIAS